jgi:hypothetical protein
MLRADANMEKKKRFRSNFHKAHSPKALPDVENAKNDSIISADPPFHSLRRKKHFHRYLSWVIWQALVIQRSGHGLYPDCRPRDGGSKDFQFYRTANLSVQSCSASPVVVLWFSLKDGQTMVHIKQDKSDHIDCRFMAGQDIPWFQSAGIL